MCDASLRSVDLKEDAYDVTLPVSEWGGERDTATERIVVGEPWLEIVEVG